LISLRNALHVRWKTLPPETLDIIVVDSASAPDAMRQMHRLVSAMPNARLIRMDQPGLCPARNRAATLARADYIAFLDDDTVPAADWAEAALRALAEAGNPAMLGGRIEPVWEQPLPDWWPSHLRGVLSIVEAEGFGPYDSSDVREGLEPCGANLIVHVPTLRMLGGFWTKGRSRETLLSDDEVQLLRRIQKAGLAAWYDSRVVVRHQIQAARLTPTWLLSRLYWQGISAVITRRLLGTPRAVWRELPRRIAVALVLSPCWLMPSCSGSLITLRWRAAYAAGFIRAACHWRLAGLL
jgi:glucosyl-dolichyl phosphate glucuronosyltransferase